MDEVEISTLVTRLSRPHSSGGVVIERAAILAEGADSPEVIAWITAHDGRPDVLEPAARGRGLHGGRLHDTNASTSRPPLRYVLPVGAVS